MDISILNHADPDCDGFVRRMPEGKMSFMPAWTHMIEKTFGHQGFYLAAREGNSVRGVLPLVQVRSRLFGNRMISQAFSNYGGPLAEEAAVSNALCDQAVELGAQQGCELVEFRSTHPVSQAFEVRTDKITMHLPLHADPDRLWDSFKAKVRNQVRKAEKSGIVAVAGGPELLNDFYRVWTVRMHQVGTPCYPRKLFGTIMETFPDECRIFLVRKDDLTVGGAFVYCFNDLVQIRWAAALIEYNSLCPNNLLYWSVMKHYCLAGASCFDFGRCNPGEGTFRFKKQWDAKPIQLYYGYWSGPGQELPLVRPDSPRFQRKVEIWKKLPLWAARLIGPVISRDLA